MKTFLISLITTAQAFVLSATGRFSHEPDGEITARGFIFTVIGVLALLALTSLVVYMYFISQIQPCCPKQCRFINLIR